MKTLEELITQCQVELNNDGNVVFCYPVWCRTPAKQEEILAELKQNKSEIKNFLAEKKKKAEEYQLKEEQFLSQIPNLKEIQAELDVRSRWRAEFERAMEDEAEDLSSLPKKMDNEKFAELKKSSPTACFILHLKNEMYSENDEISTIATETYNSMIYGKPYKDAKASYNKAKDDFCKKHFWD